MTEAVSGSGRRPGEPAATAPPVDGLVAAAPDGQPVGVIEGPPLLVHDTLVLVPVVGLLVRNRPHDHAAPGAGALTAGVTREHFGYDLMPVAVVLCRPGGTSRLVVDHLGGVAHEWPSATARLGPGADRDPEFERRRVFHRQLDSDHARTMAAQAVFRTGDGWPDRGLLNLHHATVEHRAEGLHVQTGRHLGALQVLGSVVQIVGESGP